MAAKSIVYFLCVIVFSGFINNFLDIFSFNLSTLIVDLYLLAGLIYVFQLKDRLILEKYKKLLNMYIVLAIFAFLKLILDSNPLAERILGYRNYIVYSTAFLLVPALTNSLIDVRKIVVIWINSCFIVCSFSIFQGLFFDSLPTILLTPKSDDLFTFYDSNLIRTNGLIGNPINFTGFAVLFFALSFNMFVYMRKKKYLVYAIVGLIALYFTYSRVAYLGVFMIVLITYFSNAKISLTRKIKQLLGTLFVIVVLGSIYYDQLISGSSDVFIIQRLLGNEETTQSSNEDHLLDTYNAANAIGENLLLGVGFGTQGESAKGERIITDGSWFHFLLELGTPLSILLICFMIFNLKFVYSIFKRSEFGFIKSLCITFISFTCFLFIVSFVNSILIARVIYLQYWTLLGLIIAGYTFEVFSAASYRSRRHEVKWE